MNERDRIANAIRASLDKQGVELTWRVIYHAAEAVEQELASELEEAWMYQDLSE